MMRTGTHRNAAIGMAALLLTLLACAGGSGLSGEVQISPSATQIATVIIEPTSTNTSEPTQTTVPTVVASSTATSGPTPTLPGATDTTLLLRHLLLEQSAECRFPCWHGITPGVSTEEEANTRLHAVFGLNPYDFQKIDYQPTRLVDQSLAAQHYSRGPFWSIPNETDRTSYLDLTAYYEESTSTLVLISLAWFNADTSVSKISLSPQEVIEELGVPMYMAAYTHTQGRSDRGGTGFLLVYPQGAVFQFTYGEMEFPEVQSAGEEGFQVEMCLSETDTTPQGHAGRHDHTFFLTTPIPANFSELTPVQSSVIDDLMEFNYYAPIEEVYGITAEEIGERIAEGEDICLQTILH